MLDDKQIEELRWCAENSDGSGAVRESALEARFAGLDEDAAGRLRSLYGELRVRGYVSGLLFADDRVFSASLTEEGLSVARRARA